MKRVLRDVVVGAMSVGAVGGLWGGPVAFAQSPAEAGLPPLRPTLEPSATEAGQPVQFAQAQTPSTVTAPPEGQAQPAPEQPAFIGRIIVEGNERIEKSTVASYLLVRERQPFDAERIDLSIKTLFATGLFADVQIAQRGSDLVVTVIENPIISRVIFEGLNALDEDDINKEIQSKPRAVFTPARVQSDVQRIQELYRRQGRFAATITPQLRELKDQNRVDLIFEVDEGPVTGVRSINFIGNEAFDDNALKDAIGTEEKAWWRFFSNRTNYDPDALEQDREMLRQFYTNRGYADFRVLSAVAELTPDQQDFFITFNVDEGVQYTFGDVQVKTSLDRVPSSLLQAVVPIAPGSMFQGDLIEKAISAIDFTAGTGGYANVDVTYDLERDPVTRKINITFNVDEGDRVFVERINVVGNTRTVDSVIRRELRLAEGDAFNRVLLDRSRSRVRALGFFRTVEIEEEDGSEPDRKVVNVKVEEDATGELAFAAGYSSQDQFLFDVSVTERNLRGRGQYLRLRASTSSRRQTIDIGFREPKFLDRDLGVGFDIFSYATDFPESSFENQSTGLALRAGFPLNDTTALGFNYVLRQDATEIANLPVEIAPLVFVDQCDVGNPNRPLLCAQEGDFVTSLFGYRFNWDMRNDPVSPTRGFELELQQDFAGLGGDVQYLKTELSGGVYYGLLDDVVASFSLNAGYITGWGGDDVRINDRFFKGGASFRGFDVAGLGPREQIVVIDTLNPANNRLIKGDALGGNAYAIGTAQVTFPTGLPDSFGLSGAAFAEFGTLGILNERDKQGDIFTAVDGTVINRFVDDAASLRASIGISLFWDSPFGPVQFDFAEPLAKEPYDETQTFRFSTRTRF